MRRRWLRLCTVWPSHSQWPSEQISFTTTRRLPIVQLSCRLFWQSITSPRSVNPLQPRFGSLRVLAFPKDKIIFERVEISECDGHTVHKLSQQRLTANWLAPRESDCSQMHSKVSSDWLSSYIKTTQPVLEIFKMAGYFPDRPRTYINTYGAIKELKYIKPHSTTWKHRGGGGRRGTVLLILTPLIEEIFWSISSQGVLNSRK